ncbi:MAG: beta-ketoacyl-ACP synthase 3, partial [Immundisolibacteraceae bacterium]|nr:beta-ketoacyl-ACP synthase 3 [Immundisolibacteraceae bacterium]
PAVIKLMENTNTNSDEIDLLIFATATADMMAPASANLTMHKAGIVSGFGYDIHAVCSGFLFALATAAKFIESGQYKKVIVCGFDKMSTVLNYSDRDTATIFGDGGGAVMLEPNTEGLGVQDSILESDGSGWKYLGQKAGGSANPPSHKTIDEGQHVVYQEGKIVFKWAVSKMVDVSQRIMDRNSLKPEDLAYLVPHQANLRIVESVQNLINIAPDRVMVNIQKYGNTSSGSIPLCLWDWESKLDKGDNLVLVAFGAGFNWGAIYLKWAY